MRTLEIIDINIPGCELELKMDSHDVAEAGHGVQSLLEAEQLSQEAIFYQTYQNCFRGSWGTSSKNISINKNN